MKNLIKVVISLLLVYSCTKLTPLPTSNYSLGGGVFVVNEGNYLAGNGSISFYSYDSAKIYNDLFYKANGRPLGDVPNAMAIKGDKAYIIVNNSGKIEIADQATLVSKGTITRLISPRNICFVNDNKAYVSSLYSDSLAVINLTTSSISGYINLRRTSEAIAVAGNKAFILNWAGGNEVMVVNTLNDKVLDSVVVGKEPESMAFDKYGMLWVLCNGGYLRQNNAELVKINTSTNLVEKTFTFPTKEASPTCLKSDGLGENLYYLDNGVRRLSINSADLPSAPIIIPQPGQNFYQLGINPLNNEILVTDAVDFEHPGYLIFYDQTGKVISNQQVGIIPGSMYFKLRINTTAN